MLFADKLNDIIEILEQDGVILYPTDTIWGLGCDIFSKKATQKVYKIKERPFGKPFILLVSNLKMLKKYVNIHPRIETLLAYHTQPLTVIYSETKGLPDWALSESKTVAIRIISDPFCNRLIELLGHPIVSTSANKANHPFPTCFDDISFDIISDADYIVRHRREDMDFLDPSVIISYDRRGEINFIRE